ncbi:MAG: hypothetical protein RLZZ576_680 [Actinomycetota bacterium]
MSQTQSAPGERSLSKSIFYGLLLGLAFLGSILFVKALLLVLLGAAVAAGAWELSTALRKAGWYVPRVPVVFGTVAIMPATFFGGAVWQWGVTAAMIFFLVLWRTVHLLWERRESITQSFTKSIRDFRRCSLGDSVCGSDGAYRHLWLSRRPKARQDTHRPWG